MIIHTLFRKQDRRNKVCLIENRLDMERSNPVNVTSTNQDVELLNSIVHASLAETNSIGAYFPDDQV